MDRASLRPACKTLVKQRLCGSGMRWKNKGAKVILSLRALVQSKGRWQQFWGNIEQYGAQALFVVDIIKNQHP